MDGYHFGQYWNVKTSLELKIVQLIKKHDPSVRGWCDSNVMGLEEAQDILALIKSQEKDGRVNES